jgi:hypothetical protein
LVAAFIVTRRVIYFKNSPGDCGANVRPQIGSTGQIGLGIGVAAGADPEPISAGILSGVTSIFGVFTAHHIKAVQTEQATLCAVAAAYNQSAEQIENLVASGQIDPPTAVAYLQQVVNMLLSQLAPIRKSCNAACGFTYALQALVLYNGDVVYPSLYNASTSAIGAAPGTPGGSQVVIPSAPLNDLLTGNLSPNTWKWLAAAGIAVVILAA